MAKVYYIVRDGSAFALVAKDEAEGAKRAKAVDGKSVCLSSSKEASAKAALAKLNNGGGA